MQHEGVTKKVIGVCFEVINELGGEVLESVYQKALVLALRQAGLQAVEQERLEVIFRGENVGVFYADLIVDSKVLVEVKAVQALRPEHQAQVINYLKATGFDVGLLVNFGKPKLEVKRLHR